MDKSYIDYSCSGSKCVYTSDDCSDCSCSCGGYNTAESIANGNCADTKDNNCNGESDYDSSDGMHGDSGCPVGVTSISVSNAQPMVGSSITVDCTSTVAGVNSISASVDGSSCSWQSWNGNIARFSCNVGSSFGSKTVKGYVDSTKSYVDTITAKPEAGQKAINVLASTCSEYTSSSPCEGDSRCDWCSGCAGVKYTGGSDRCINTGNCPSPYCWKGQCGATCDSTQGGCPSVQYACDQTTCSCVCRGTKEVGFCSNGVDDDCDGKTDCSDTECSSDPACLGCEPEICNDGKDNDCDHYPDCKDDDCIGDPACATCNNGGPSVKEDCDNGKDDDCDGKFTTTSKDCADNNCIGDPACATCNNGGPSVKEICYNGKDDDCDGLIDNLDWDCPGCSPGTTLCSDGICRANCAPYSPPSCNNNRVCEEGEGCNCKDCEEKTDTCQSLLTCVEGICMSCSIINAYWTRDCIGSDIKNGVSMVVEGTKGCAGRTATLDLWEDDSSEQGTFGGLGSDDHVKLMSKDFANGKAEQKWTPEFFEEDALSEKGDTPNDCATTFCDAEKYSGNPPKSSSDFLEYYFIAKVGKESFQSGTLKVHYCIPDCDADCDTFIDNSLRGTAKCQEKIGEEDIPEGLEKNYPYLDKGKIKIDANPKSGYCEDCREDGLSPGQQTCAADYDCTPGWWGSTTPDGWDEKMKNEATDALEWSECDGTPLVRIRYICPKPNKCCTDINGDNIPDQVSCYCKLPTDPACTKSEFLPSTVKACLVEEKFPFFTNMNILIAVLILIGFYLWKTREKTNQKRRRAKTKRRNS